MTSRIKGLMRSMECGTADLADLGKDVTLCGWINKYRNLGGLHFVDLRDKSGLIQLSFEVYLNSGGDASVFKDFSHETVIMAKGKIGPRPETAINPEMKTGSIELVVSEIEVLSACDRHELPFIPNSPKEATEDLRLKYRYLDLRTPKLQNVLKLRSDVSFRARKALLEENFIEVETPILYKSTPEGARDYLVPSRVHPGQVYALPQSPQTLKQLLMVGGTDRYFQVAKCFRDEDLRVDRQPEFTQIDIEVSFCELDYIKNLSRVLMAKTFGLDESKIDFQTISYQQCLELYGSDKPDTRFGLIHQNFTQLFLESDFSVFKTVAEQRGLIKGIFLSKETGELSRKDIDGLVNIVKPYGGKGVAFFKVNNGEISGGISKFINPEMLKSFFDKQDSPDGIWLFSADKESSRAHACMDAVRKFLGQKFDMYEDVYKFLWVDNFPLFDWDEQAKQLIPMHHPFTMPSKKNLDQFLTGKPEELKEMTADCYDVVCNGYELASGSLRIYDPKIQQRMFELLGLGPEEAQEKFGFFIEALNYGTPPHGGIAFGLDRIIMLLAKSDNIKDVVAFPKTTSASDLMSDCPSMPVDGAFEELGISVLKKD
jgi:aspartyl-tRNA synthetase